MGTNSRLLRFLHELILDFFIAMVLLDNLASFGHIGVKRFAPKHGLLVSAIASGALVVVIATIILNGFSDNGFRLASQFAWRYTSVAYFAALVVVPSSNLLAHFHAGLRLHDNVGRKLIWGFCASYGVYLLSIFLPNVVDPSAGAALMFFFSAAVVIVMAATAAPLKALGCGAVIGEATRRALSGTAMIYFWLCYSLTALARISGPHRPEDYYPVILVLMIAALLIRFADRLSSNKPRPRTNPI